MNKIVSLRFLACGKEEFDFNELFLQSSYGKEQLPINVILLEHRKLGHMLVNTGCTEQLKKNPAAYAKFKAAHPISFGKKDSILYQLEQEKTDPLLIKKVLLTHCYPECCGALPQLPRYELLSSAQVLCAVRFGTGEDHVMKSTLPDASVPIRAAGLFKGNYKLKSYFKFTYDLLGDGSVLGVDLKGHAHEMMGYYFPEYDLLYAADAAIDERMLLEELTPSETLLQRQALPDDYLLQLIRLRHIHRDFPETRILFLHSRTGHDPF